MDRFLGGVRSPMEEGLGTLPEGMRDYEGKRGVVLKL